MSEVRRMGYCVNGEWKMSATEKYMPITDSSTGEVIAEVPCCTADEVNEAIAAAQEAFPAWSTMSIGKRVQYMFKWREILYAHKEELSILCAKELGKNIKEARGDVQKAENLDFPEAVEFLISRNHGGFVFTGHSFDDDAALLVRSPWGAPILLARRVRLVNGAARIPVRTWFHDEVRVFVRQREGVVGCRSQPVIAKDLHRRWLVDGLDHADVRFYVQPGHETIYYRTASTEYGDSREPIHTEFVTDGTGTWFELNDYSGQLSVGWN